MRLTEQTRVIEVKRSLVGIVAIAEGELTSKNESLSSRTIKKSPFHGGFFICFRQRPRTHEGREFDKEEQARRKYRRNCDDEAAEHFICEVSLSDSPHGLFFIQIPFPSPFHGGFFICNYLHITNLLLYFFYQINFY